MERPNNYLIPVELSRDIYEQLIFESQGNPSAVIAELLEKRYQGSKPVMVEYTCRNKVTGAKGVFECGHVGSARVYPDPNGSYSTECPRCGGKLTGVVKKAATGAKKKLPGLQKGVYDTVGEYRDGLRAVEISQLLGWDANKVHATASSLSRRGFIDRMKLRRAGWRKKVWVYFPKGSIADMLS